MAQKEPYFDNDRDREMWLQNNRSQNDSEDPTPGKSFVNKKQCAPPDLELNTISGKFIDFILLINFL